MENMGGLTDSLLLLSLFIYLFIFCEKLRLNEIDWFFSFIIIFIFCGKLRFSEIDCFFLLLSLFFFCEKLRLSGKLRRVENFFLICIFYNFFIYF